MIAGVDALLIIGKENFGEGKGEDQLLLLRYFLPRPIFKDGDKAFKAFMGKSKGWVARRTGGSAGLPLYSREFFDFLSCPGTLPRQTSGSVIIKDEKQFFIYYVSPYKEDRTIKCAHYWQPHRGGKCYQFPPAFIEEHSELRLFAASKIVTAHLLKEMEPTYCVGKEAVSLEMSKIKSAIQDGGSFGSKLFFDQYIGTHCEHTIVCHPVGYHNDVFRNGATNYMENRVVLQSKQRSNSLDYPLGRGGLGNGKFAWALLDW
jgi:hypothetical protein